ncbi:glycosyltransferase [Vibrio comitans]
MSNEKRNVVFILPAMQGGGAEKSVLNLYKGLELKGYECHIILLNNKIDHDVNDSYRVHILENISKKGIKRLTYRKRFAKIVDDFIIDNIPNTKIILSNMIYADKIMSMSKLNVYHVIHNSYTTSLLSKKGKVKSLIVKNNINSVYKNHPLIFTSKSCKENYYLSFKNTFNNSVLYNANDLIEIKNLSEQPIDYKEFGDYIIHIGRFNRAKRHDILISSFSKVKNKKLKLILLGQGELEKEISQQITSLNLQERVILLGFKQNPYPYIKHAKALVLSSDFEGIPMVLMEALHLSTPVVSTHFPGGIDEILGDYTEVCTVPIGDATELALKIDDAIINPKKYTPLLEDKFSLEGAAEKYHQFIKNI